MFFLRYVCENCPFILSSSVVRQAAVSVLLRNMVKLNSLVNNLLPHSKNLALHDRILSNKVCKSVTDDKNKFTRKQ